MLAGQEMVDRARDVAFEAHAGQYDKAGQPYYLHPYAVAERVEGGDTERAVAYLHDVVEDTPITLDDLRGMGFPEEVIDGVDAMSRREGETYTDYIYRVRENPCARNVKLADLSHNTDPSRAASLTESLSKRYEQAKRILNWQD